MVRIIKYVNSVYSEQFKLHKMWCIYRKQTLHIASYETVQYPTSQILHWSKSNRRILLIFSDINGNTLIMTYLKFKWNRTIFRKLSSQNLLKAFSYANNFKQLDGLHISIILKILFKFIETWYMSYLIYHYPNTKISSKFVE